MDQNAEPDDLLHRLRETITRIESAGGGLNAAELSQSPDTRAWSLNELLWHIRATADVYGEHIHRILEEDHPTWRHVSPRARMKKSRYDMVPFAESFDAFVRQRSELVGRLESVPPEAWQRFAIVRVDNREKHLTLRERVAGMVSHEGIHCNEFEQLAAARRKL